MKNPHKKNNYSFLQFPNNEAKDEELLNYLLINLFNNWRVVHLIIISRSYPTYELSCIVYASVVL